ncbi:hypothetical protein DRP77_02990, partial [Candidatus Poribacteria bacterium]
VRKGIVPQKPGGGMAERMGIEMPTVAKLVSFWSGVLESDERGEIRVSFDVPQYIGKLRVMVAAVDPVRMGSAERWVRVTSDVVVLASPPRFLYSGDEAELPIALKNATDETQRVKLTVKLDGEPAEGVPGSIELKPKGTEVVWVPVGVGKLTGTIAVEIEADWGKGRFSDGFEIPVLPNAPFRREARYVQVGPGETDLLASVKGWLPEHQTTRITLTPALGLSRLAHLKYLIRYPYGCVEQTSSSLLPLVKLRPILELVDPDLIEEGEIEVRVQSGIARLLSMQTPSGGFAFWPGGGSPARWASVYATFVLLEAKEAGYGVPESALKMALDYVDRYARAEPFGYFVLARGGRLDSADLDEIPDLAAKTSAEGKLFFAGALFLGGRAESADELLREALKTYAVRSRSLFGDFYSPLRERAVRLYIRELIHPGAPENQVEVVPLVRELGRHSWYYSTQELAWSTLALGTRIQNVPYSRDYEASLMANGEELQPRKADKALVWFIKSASKLRELKLRVKGKGALYAAIENAGFREGDRFEPASEGGVEVSKRLLDETGALAQEIKQGEVYFVEITLTNRRGYALRNVAVEDFIPAGFEIENPRLPGTARRWISEKGVREFKPEYVDYRDESVRAFGTLHSGRSKYLYVVRAVTPGRFLMPPVNVVVMYSPDIRASSGAGEVKVLRR